MRLSSVYSFIQAQIGTHRPQLRFTLRLTLSALLAFAVAQPWNFPLRGLWAVLTAIVVTQVSVGGSILAISEYVVGTLAGAVYASAVALLIPHATNVALGGVLALSIIPLALSAALNPMFRVAPFTAAIVLFISTEYGQSPIESAVYRMLEVVLGGLSVIVVSFFVVPEKAHERGLKAAARILERLADALPQLLTGFSRELAGQEVLRIQEGLGAAIAQFQAIAAETKRERLPYFHREFDLDSLAHVLLRLRHDFVIIGRAAVTPLPETFMTRLNPSIKQAGESISAFLRDCSETLTKRSEPPPLAAVESAIEQYEAAFAVLRHEGLTRPIPGQEIERIFALGFALEQLHRNLLDLRHRIEDCAGPATPSKTKARV